MDLPCSDATAGIEEYVDVVLDALGDAQNVVLVGHSLGGLTATVVADRRHVDELVVLAALLPKPGTAISDDLLTFDDTFVEGWVERSARQLVGAHGSSTWPVDAAVDTLYHDCEPGLAGLGGSPAPAPGVDRGEPAQPAPRLSDGVDPRHRVRGRSGAEPAPAARWAGRGAPRRTSDLARGRPQPDAGPTRGVGRRPHLRPA